MALLAEPAAEGEEAARVPPSVRPSFAADAGPPGPGFGPSDAPPGPPPPRRAPPQEAPPSGPCAELLGLCGVHLQLLGRLLAAEEAPREVAVAMFARSSGALERALAGAGGAAEEAVSLSPLDPQTPWSKASRRRYSNASAPPSPPLSPAGAKCAATASVASVPSDLEAEKSRDIIEALASQDVLAWDQHQHGLGKHARRVRDAMNSAWLETFWLACIVISSVFVAIEEQYRGSLLGNRFGWYDEMGSRTDPELEGTLLAVEICFAILFTIEVSLRMIAMGSKFWSDWKCVLDLLVVVATDIAMVLDQLVTVSFNLQVVRLLRLTRVMRVIRLTRNIAHFESATVMAAALRSCVGSANCVIVIFSTALTLLALLMTRIMRDAYLGDGSPLDQDQKLQVWLYFGTYTRSMMSLFELALANWPEIGRFLQDEVHEGWMTFVILYKLTVGFAVVGILNAVFMQETFTAIEMDNSIMVEKKKRADRTHRKKMEALFKRADRNGDGCLGRHEFAFILTNPLIRMWLASMNLDVSDTKLLFDLIDSEHPDGKITSDELISGVARLRGPARSLDVKALRMLLEGGGGRRRQLSQAEDIPAPRL